MYLSIIIVIIVTIAIITVCALLYINGDIATQNVADVISWLTGSLVW